jgi:hypothetical protein
MVGERAKVIAEVRKVLTQFVQNVFNHIPGRQIGVGDFLGPGQAARAIQACLDAQ